MTVFGVDGGKFFIDPRPHLEHVIELPHEWLHLFLSESAVLLMNDRLKGGRLADDRRQLMIQWNQIRVGY